MNSVVERFLQSGWSLRLLLAAALFVLVIHFGTYAVIKASGAYSLARTEVLRKASANQRLKAPLSVGLSIRRVNYLTTTGESVARFIVFVEGADGVTVYYAIEARKSKSGWSLTRFEQEK